MRKINKISRKLGFTLVELLVVISIIGIITTIISSSFINSQQRSRDASRKTGLKSLSDALNTYYADNGVFPTADVINGLVATAGEFSDNTNPANKIIYMKKVPKETFTGMRQVLYETSAGRKSFRIYTNLENAEDKDCLTAVQCPNFNFTKGCCYVITSSNASINSLP